MDSNKSDSQKKDLKNGMSFFFNWFSVQFKDAFFKSRSTQKMDQKKENFNQINKNSKFNRSSNFSKQSLDFKNKIINESSSIKNFPLSDLTNSISSRQNLPTSDIAKQQVVSITYEEIGLFPRSFNRVFDRFFKQLFFDVENLVIQEYRFYRYLFLTTVKCLFILIFLPFLVNFICKNYLLKPIIEFYWNSKQGEIFLNAYQQKRAFSELKEFEEKIYFESLIISAPNLSNSNLLSTSSNSIPSPSIVSSFSHEKNENTAFFPKLTFFSNSSESEIISNPKLSSHISQNKNYDFKEEDNNNKESYSISKFMEEKKERLRFASQNANQNFSDSINQSNKLSDLTFFSVNNQRNRIDESIQKLFHDKTLEIAKHYNEESIEAITNFFADLVSFSTLFFLLFNLEIQINITKSFLLEVFFGLDDSKKSLLILFITDLLVGYHSPNIWELFFSSLFDHYGLPESQTTIFLLVATLPVLLDVLFKYLIFRHLNRASPATVATYHAMIE